MPAKYDPPWPGREIVGRPEQLHCSTQLAGAGRRSLFSRRTWSVRPLKNHLDQVTRQQAACVRGILAEPRPGGSRSTIPWSGTEWSGPWAPTQRSGASAAPPPDSVSWTNIDEKAILARTVVMTSTMSFSIPAVRPGGYYRNAAAIDWPQAVTASRSSSMRNCIAPWFLTPAGMAPSPRTSSLSCRGGLACPLAIVHGA
jgi:hypothetical protein